MRLNKYLAENNIASRREADALIKAGLVFVNGKRAELGQDVDPDTDKITVKTTQTKTLIYLAYHKPKGVDSLESVKKIPDLPKNLALVGRLDKDSSGLMLLTNDGRVTRKITSPQNKITKEYRVTIDKKITPWLLRHLEKKVSENDSQKLAKIKLISDYSLDIILADGRKQQLPKFLADLGASIKTFHRLSIGSIKLSGLGNGQTRELKETEIKELLK